MDGAILVLDKMPDNCRECPCGKDISNPLEICILCKATPGCVIDGESEQRPEWCPLIPATPEEALKRTEVQQAARYYTEV